MPIQYLRPISVGTNDSWTLTTAPTKWQVVDPGPVPDLSGNYGAGLGTVTIVNSSAAQQAFRFGTRPAMALITSVEPVVVWGISGGADSTLNARTKLSGVAEADHSALMNSSSGTLTWAATNPRAGSGGVWSVEDVLNQTLEVECGISWGATLPLTVFWRVAAIKLTYVAVPSQNEQSRDMAARWMNEHRRDSAVVTLPGMPLDWLDLEIGDEFSLTDDVYPTSAGYGAGDKRPDRALLRLLGFQSISVNGNTVTLLAADLRDQLTTFRDTGLANGPAAVADGVLRLDRGQTRAYTRASKATVEDPDVIVRELQIDSEKLDRRGMMIERASTNGMKNSSFRNSTGTVNTFANWTPTGTGTNGSSITEDTARLFDSGITARCVKFLAGTPHTVAIMLESDASASLVARRLSIDHEGANTETWTYRLIRQSDGFFWNDATPGFQVGTVQNTVTHDGTRQRYTSNVIPTAAADTYKVQLRFAAGGTSGRITRFHHIQLETVPWASSRIVTDAASATRALETLTISNNSGKRSWEALFGSGEVVGVPNWSSADVAGLILTIFRTRHDANNIMALYYDGTAGQFIHYRRAAGVDYMATFAQAVTAGTRYAIGWRATGSEGELGVAAYTISVFVNGVKGTDATAAALAEQATADLTIGTDVTAGTCFDGAISLINFRQQVYTDVEMAREAALLLAAS